MHGKIYMSGEARPELVVSTATLPSVSFRHVGCTNSVGCCLKNLIRSLSSGYSILGGLQEAFNWPFLYSLPRRWVLVEGVVKVNGG